MRSFKATVTWGEDEHKVLVRVTPGHPAVMYLRNGDPGYPADPDEVEVLEFDGDPRHDMVGTLQDDDAFAEYVLMELLSMGSRP